MPTIIDFPVCLRKCVRSGKTNEGFPLRSMRVFHLFRRQPTCTPLLGGTMWNMWLWQSGDLYIRQTGRQAGSARWPRPCTCSACQSTPSLISAVYITGLLLTVSVHRLCSVFSRNSMCTWSQARAFHLFQSTMVPNSNILKDAAQRKWFMSLQRETVYKSVVLFVNDLLEKEQIFLVN